MPPASERAVFLSYASQDADAARRICEALRAIGVEVWFDQNELVGGDAWDAKIRKQIKDCTLFVPIISANTQARTEGYFRLEWRLADQRTHLMAKGRPFLLPVVIDETRDSDAHVPDSFLDVQWTRLPGGETPPNFCARVQKLLGGEVAPVSDRRSDADEATNAGQRPAPPRKHSLHPWLVPTILGIAAIVALLIWSPWRPKEKPAASATSPTITSAGSSETARIRARLVPDQWQKGDFEALSPTLDRIILANQEDSDAWALRSIINSLQVMRNLDSGTKPLEAGKAAAERALRLAPASPLAELALGLHLVAMISRGGDPQAGPQHVARALATLPPDALTRYADLVSVWLSYNIERSEQSAKSWLAAEPGATFPAWILAQSNVTQRRPADAEKWAEAAAADQNITGTRAFYTLFESKFYLRADLAAAKATLARIDPGGQAVHRVVHGRWLLAMAEQRWDEALQQLAQVPEPMLYDRPYHGPRALLAGLAHQRAGRADAALAQFREAERLLRSELAVDADNEELHAVLAVTLACAGRAAEARGELALVEPLVKGQTPSVYRGALTVAIAQTYGVLGEFAHVAEWMRKLFVEQSGFPFTPASFRLDPRFAGTSDAPEIQVLLKEFASLDQRSPTDAVDQKSVAVLAFANLSDDKDNEYFSDGISEELLNVLAKVPGLKVSARTSAFYFKGKNAPIPEIAQKLGVAYVVEGSVRKSGSKVRITAQLIKAEDGFHVWSDNFDRELKDIFAVQDEIAGLIAQNLRLKMSMGAERAPTNPEAYRLVLQGRFAARQESNAGRRQSIEFFRRAIGLEPAYGLAWAEMAQSYIRLARFGGLSTTDGMKEARIAAQKSLELDPDQPIALDAMGWVQRTADWDWRAAQKSFQRALALAPENSAVLTDASIAYFNVGRVDDALALARQAAERDPLNAMAQISLADLLWNRGQLQECVEQMRRGLKLAPEIEEYRTHFAIALAQLKRFPEADALVEAEPNAVYRLFGRGYVAGLRGDRAASAKARDELVEKHGASMTGYIAMLYVLEGNRDEAFAWLERAYRERDSSACWVKTTALYDDLKRDPRWPTVLRKLGLADDQVK